MRAYGVLHPTDLVPVPPDTVGVAIISTALAVVAQDWPSGAQIVTFGATMSFYANLGTTSVNVPSTNQSGTTVSSGLNEYVPPGATYQIPGASTGYSLTSPTSGVITMSFWRK